MRKITCVRSHRMIEVVNDLWLCECSANGRKSSMMGAAEEGRRIVEASGGWDALRDRVVKDEERQKQKRIEARFERTGAV